MKKLYILLAFLLLSKLSVAQIIFTYDTAGNRIHRQAGASIQLSVKVFLQGAYTSGTTMQNNIHSGVASGTGISLLPLTQPYTSGHGVKSVYNGSEHVTALPATAVDWVLVQLRSTATGIPVAQRAGILLQNGNVVDITAGFASPLVFTGVATGNYFIVVRHRNHLGVMSASAQPLSGTTIYNFTTGNGQGYNLDGNNTPLKQLASGLFGMWGGDANHDGQVYYYGPDNDSDAILNDYLHGDSSNGYNTNYEDGDLNMDGQTYYYGQDNDRDWLVNYPLAGNPSDGYLLEQVP